VPRARRGHKAVTALLELTRTLMREGPLEDALRAVTEVALELVPGDHASIRLLDAAKASFLSGARSGKGVGERPLAFGRREGLLGWVVEHRASICLDDAEKDTRFVAARKQGFRVRSIIAEPLWAGGDVIGVLSISSSKRAAFSDEDTLLIRLLANCSVSPIENARLRRLAVVDDLTLAFNHRFLLPRVREEMERSRRMGTPLSLALLDLDHFKRVNDRHGHIVGDRVLQGFADRVRQNVRRIDVLVRRSGEEFILIMPSTSAREARTSADRIRKMVAAEPLDAEGMPIPQTVSIGVATWDGVESPESLERRADHAMYGAKHAGRNRVMVAERTQRSSPRGRAVRSRRGPSRRRGRAAPPPPARLPAR
jgi:two-component system, cell cycle response regulator